MSTGSHPLMKSHEVAEALRLAHATIRSWSAHGGGPIKPVKIGSRVFWNREDVERLLAGGAQ
ncbi:helix-turn-helix domain-containing protein [Paraburkholderia sp. BL17N1]|uniref:helix-turn-helix transcriptional regulator n=1 Tax=Paraburkholderia sp. BL17N1 TaxID=1938798 RepID=UPI000EB298B2|nr:helix-turn-helix domain-containing protein [Paraburkholderia sp. BL17N1]RKR44567.1 helix-turn-helix protein [Paraburkholderia sp. BL17N1]